MKHAFYHFKDAMGSEYCQKYDSKEKVGIIKDDCAGNAAVLDAIYDTETKRLVIYNKGRYTEEDYVCNVCED